MLLGVILSSRVSPRRNFNCEKSRKEPYILPRDAQETSGSDEFLSSFVPKFIRFIMPRKREKERDGPSHISTAAIYQIVD